MFSKQQLSFIKILIPLIDKNAMKFKYGAVLFKGSQIINLSTNSQGEKQYNCYTKQVEEVSACHAEQTCLLNSLKTLWGKQWCIL